MFCKLYVRPKSILFLAISWDYRKIVVRYFWNWAAGEFYACRPVPGNSFKSEPSTYANELSPDVNSRRTVSTDLINVLRPIRYNSNCYTETFYAATQPFSTVVLKKNKHEHKDAKIKQVWYDSVMLTRPAGHKAKAQAEARKSGAEDEAGAQNFFRGRDNNVWGRGRGQTR